MKTKKYVALLAICLTHLVRSQDDGVKLNQMMAPSSPAFNLLGISPETIERPTNPTDFALSLNNASQNLSIIPSNYALEIAPFLLMNKKSLRWEDFVGNKPKYNVPQTAMLSIGTATSISKVDSSTISQIAVGWKISIFRGKTSDDYVHWKASIDSVLKKQNNDQRAVLEELKAQDIIYQLLLKNAKDTTKTFEEKKTFRKAADDWSRTVLEPKTREKSGPEKGDSIRNAFISKMAKRTDFIRTGWKLDAAAGIILDFPSNKYENGRTSKAAFWLTGGYDDPEKNSYLGTLRVNAGYFTTVLNDSGKVIPFVNTHIVTFDAGAKLIHNLSEKCYLTGEVIVRAPLDIGNKKVFEDNHIGLPKKTERWTVAINYNVGNNQNISFTFGRNFSGNFENKNSLIAFLTYMIGIGSKRPVN
jgi:hypothetical protein